MDRLGGQLQPLQQGQTARHHGREGARHPRCMEIAQKPADQRDPQKAAVEAKAGALVAQRPRDDKADRDEAEQ